MTNPYGLAHLDPEFVDPNPTLRGHFGTNSAQFSQNHIAEFVPIGCASRQVKVIVTDPKAFNCRGDSRLIGWCTTSPELQPGGQLFIISLCEFKLLKAERFSKMPDGTLSRQRPEWNRVGGIYAKSACGKKFSAHSNLS
jgi:hypothetical protein